jgi:glycosyltransferase involved in cell wall biosynthesis
MRLERLLFASCHGYVDPSNGAATATRDLLELLSTRGVDCRVLSTGVLDFHEETRLGPVLDTLGVDVHESRAALARGDALDVFDLELRGVRVTLMPTASSRIERSPDRDESLAFLDLADQILERFRPQVLLTYGGHPVNLELMARARRRGVSVVFYLHNFAYDSRLAFRDASGVLVPTDYCRRFYARRIGLECTTIPYPFYPPRVIASDPEPRYLTFVNPVHAKGVTVFARIAAELDRLRPDIPILVVEARGTADGLADVGLDLSSLRNLHRMANTTDPRDFYRVSRAVLMPSLWLENGGLVAREAMANGIPVLSSDRGGLPETLGDAGFVFHVPARCTPSSREVPTAREVAPWVATIQRLWDDPAWEAKHRALALEASKRWDPDRLAGQYLAYFKGLLAGNGR